LSTLPLCHLRLLRALLPLYVLPMLQMLLSGVSAGGMMVQTLLCQSPAVSAAVTVAVDMLGGIGSDYALGPQCEASSAVPFLKLQGTDDPSITFDKQILVDGVNFLSAIEATQQRAKHNGCSASDAGPQATEADGKIKCTDYCGKAAGKAAAKICGMIGVGHTTDFPHPGFVFEQAWLFFEQQAKLQKPAAAVAAPAAAATAVAEEKSLAAGAGAAAAAAPVPAAKPVKPVIKPAPVLAAATAKAAQTKAVAAAAAGHAKGPLQLTMIFPGELQVLSHRLICHHDFVCVKCTGYRYDRLAVLSFAAHSSTTKRRCETTTSIAVLVTGDYLSKD
jgi:hypothetical protein